MATTPIASGETRLRVIVAAIQSLQQGGSDATGTFTLATGVSSTTVDFVNCSPTAIVFVIPMTADAAAEIASGNFYIPQATIKSGSFVVQHTNNSKADRTFGFVCLG